MLHGTADIFYKDEKNLSEERMKIDKHILMRFLVALTAIIVMLTSASCGAKDATRETTSAEDTVSDSAQNTESAEEKNEITYETVTEDGKNVGRRGYDASGNLVVSEDLDFLERVVRSVSFNSDGTKARVTDNVFLDGTDVPDHYSVTKYEYSEGTLLNYSVTTYHIEGLPDSYYEYDASGALSGAILYEYNEKGIVISETRINSKNVKYSIIDYEYNENGKILKEIYKNGAGDLTSYSEYTYNEDGNILRQSNYISDGTMNSYTEYEYDENGNNTGTYEYGLDENGEFVLIF